MMKRSLSLALLFATATAAAAEVKISGYGRFGLDYNDRNASSGVNGIGAPANGVSSTTITSRLRLQFDFSTETDGAVTLGSRLRVEAESRDNVAVTPGFNGAYFFARYGGMTVGVGNILGAIDAMPGFKINNPATGIGIDGAGFHDEVANVAANVAGQFGNWDAYSSTAAGPNGLEILYKSGAFSGHLSYSRTNTDIAPVGDGIPGNASPSNRTRIAMNLAYTFGDWTAVLGGQASDTAGEDKLILAVMGQVGPVGLRFAYADNEGIRKYGIYGDMDVGTASNVLVFVTSEEAADAGAIAQGRDNRDNVGPRVGALADTGGEGESYGVHYSYDLGGGASVEAGAVRSSNDQTQVQAGVFFRF
ncbi:porin [Seohaeicola zhoushanensis]|uniref:Porin domain-containing protein n=1 Tax=Seohaeicola zhoushanensis TaxID=1569283 RepID=A0A8J3GU93_9RHOB|nr:porin [Seohaeicola zhoushanensis]GHF34657.1 hypothetical protein GCM10017056_02650 [Seohaeicola zhoushanensis]